VKFTPRRAGWAVGTITAVCLAVTVAAATGVITGTGRSVYERGPIPPPAPDMISRLDALAETDARAVINVRSPWHVCAPRAPRREIPLDEAAHRYFAEYYVQARDARLDIHAELFVRSRVLIGPGLVGYLLVVPGMYDPNVVDLWVFDVLHDRWLPPIELADAWGDAGEWHYMEAWLIDLDRDGYRDVVKRRKDGYLERLTADTTSAWSIKKTGITPMTTPASLKHRFDVRWQCR
jgi:hypothetical protein